MDKITIKDNGNNLDTYQETYTRDYWLKLYAGMVLQGMSTIVNLKLSIDGEYIQTTNENIAMFCRAKAQALVDEMFKDES